METLEWNQLAGVVDKKDNKNKILYSDNSHLFTKIAFDVFQLNSSPIESLWTLEDDGDGKQYLVAMYDSPEGDLTASSNWEALADKTASNITLLYKDAPICRFASQDYGFTSDDIHIFENLLINKLSTDKKFLHTFLNSQSEEKKSYILNRFPELLE